MLVRDLIVLAPLALGACADEAELTRVTPAAPALASLQVLDLEQLDALIAAKRGKGLLLNFWATW